ncbi:MAG: DUF488 domain-containing protein [Candidatus Magasanikbacteria bacterium]|jgi:hypothetical protein|nr:DUF488 domain-containing protein [Candidatus Magasanikbacteria bacterium]
MSQEELFQGDKPKAPDAADPPSRKHPQPPNLRLVYTISLALHAESIVKLLGDMGVTLLVDIRRSVNYQSHGFQARQADLMFVLSLCGIEYLHALNLAPSKALRSAFWKMVKGQGIPDSFDPSWNAWTNFLRGYGDELRRHRPLQHGEFREEAIYGPHEAIVLACACKNHCDCHRQYAAGIVGIWVEGLTVKHLYPPEPAFQHLTERVLMKGTRKLLKVLECDIPEAGLTRERPPGRQG